MGSYDRFLFEDLTLFQPNQRIFMIKLIECPRDAMQGLKEFIQRK